MTIATKYRHAAAACRAKRHTLFLRLAGSLLASRNNRRTLILDIGGAREYWEALGIPSGVVLALDNPAGSWCFEEGAAPGWIKMPAAKASDMRLYLDDGYHIAFSNSTLTYVGGKQDRACMAGQMQRIAARIFLQTPNRWFPICWRTCIPFFHWLPVKLRARIMACLPNTTKGHHGWQHFGRGYEHALKYCREVEDVSHSELRRIFPKATIIRERAYGVTKSFIVHQGFVA